MWAVQIVSGGWKWSELNPIYPTIQGDQNMRWWSILWTIILSFFLVSVFVLVFAKKIMDNLASFLLRGMWIIFVFFICICLCLCKKKYSGQSGLFLTHRCLCLFICLCICTWLLSCWQGCGSSSLFVHDSVFVHVSVVVFVFVCVFVFLSVLVLVFEMNND